MTNESRQPTEQPLESWKEIAAHLKRDVRTVMRWEKSEGLPVHRYLHQARSSVYAYPSELDAWKIDREPRLNAPILVSPWRRATAAVGFALTVLLSLVSVASGPILTSRNASARQLAGTVTRLVWAGPYVDIEGAVSSDGRYISYTDWETGDLAIRELQTGMNRRLTNKGSWYESGEYADFSAISPDGKQVAYGWSNKDGFCDLRLVGVDGAGLRVLYGDRHLDWIQPAGWSPDGKQILATFFGKNGTNQIVLVSVADGSARVLKMLGWRMPVKPALSPDGLYVAYDFRPKEDSPQRDIALISTDGELEAVLVEHPANDLCPVWTPDGRRILFSSDRTGSLGAWVIQVADGKPQGQAELVKQDLGKRILPMGITPGGSLYYGLETGMMDVYTASLDFKTGKLVSAPAKAIERFVGSNSSPDWSPDGRNLAYISHRGQLWEGSYVVCIQSLETGAERVLSPKLSYIFSARWSPEGRSILLLARDARNRHGLHLMDVESGTVTPVVQNREGVEVGWTRPTWSPDGKAIFYVRQEPGNKKTSLVARELETGQEKEVYRAPAGVSVHGAAVSPDGRWVAFRSFDQEKGAVALEVVASSGGVSRELVREEKGETIPGFTPLEWTPDGRQVLFTKASSEPQDFKFQLWRVPAEGGKAQKVDLAVEGGLRDLRIHPDGQQIAYTAGEPMKSEVWVMENFLPPAKAAK
jgi:Tol biopolymer transport system component